MKKSKAYEAGFHDGYEAALDAEQEAMQSGKPMPLIIGPDSLENWQWAGRLMTAVGTVGASEALGIARNEFDGNRGWPTAKARKAWATYDEGATEGWNQRCDEILDARIDAEAEKNSLIREFGRS